MKHLQHMLATYVYGHYNIYTIQIKHFNIRLKQLKQLKHTLAIYVYSQRNICNIQIKHLQHTFETAKTFETYTCNIHV